VIRDFLNVIFTLGEESFNYGCILEVKAICTKERLFKKVYANSQTLETDQGLVGR